MTQPWALVAQRDLRRAASPFCRSRAGALACGPRLAIGDAAQQGHVAGPDRREGGPPCASKRAERLAAMLAGMVRLAPAAQLHPAPSSPCTISLWVRHRLAACLPAARGAALRRSRAPSRSHECLHIDCADRHGASAAERPAARSLPPRHLARVDAHPRTKQRTRSPRRAAMQRGARGVRSHALTNARLQWPHRFWCVGPPSGRAFGPCPLAVRDRWCRAPAVRATA